MSSYDQALLARFNHLQMTPLSSNEAQQQNLPRIAELLDHLGNPQKRLPIVHVAGTSGKGSVVAILGSLLRAHGVKAGLYTSPHLQTPLERIQIDGQLVEPARFHQAATQVLNTPFQLRFVEGWFTTALLAFAEADCDCAVIEVGSGGRFNTTNIVQPVISVINTVGYDHMALLGDSLEQIAWHKAGVIKPETPCVVGEVPHKAIPVIEHEARRQQAPLIRVGRDVQFTIHASGIDFEYKSTSTRLQARCGLLGRHQAHNATVALATFEQLAARGTVTMTEQQLRKGLEQARFAGRLEVMQQRPTVVLDGAHNEQKLMALVESIEALFDYERLIVLFGAMQSKALRSAPALLDDLAHEIIITEYSTAHLGAMPMTALSQQFHSSITTIKNPTKALQHALESAGPDDMVLITGSLYLVGALRSYWHPTKQVKARRSMWG